MADAAQDAAPPAPRPRRRAVKAIAALVAVAASLLLAEGAARLVTAPPAPAYLDHPYLRRVRAPGASQALISPLTGEPFTLHVDAWGFRATSLEPPGTPKRPGAYRIVFVGASTTENIALPDPLTFPALVERDLPARLGPGAPRLQVANAGLSGNTIADTLSLVTHRLPAVQPDLVVALEGINDLCLALAKQRTGGLDEAHLDDARPPARPSFGDALAARSRLVQLARRAGDRLDARGRAEVVRARRQGQPFTTGLDPQRGLAYFRRSLRQLAAACKAIDVPLLLLTMPTLYKEPLSPEEDAALWMGWLDHGRTNVDPATLRRGMQLYNQAVREAAQEAGCGLLDLEPLVPKDLAHLYDDCHGTAKGNEVIARALVDHLARGLPRPAR